MRQHRSLGQRPRLITPTNRRRLKACLTVRAGTEHVEYPTFIGIEIAIGIGIVSSAALPLPISAGR